MTLDPTVLDTLKGKLVEEKRRLESELSRFAKPTGTEGDFKTQFEDIGPDPDENATEVEGYVDNLGLEASLESQLKDVREALDKMDRGVYGICEKTGQAISLDRLMAYPAARTAL